MISNLYIRKVLISIYQSSFFIPIIIFIISFTIYLITLAPTYLPPDGAEFALCIQTVGICHPTGFFLYILLGKLFTILFPYGTLIYKVNLLSAFYASGTLLVLYLSLIKMDVNKRISFLVVLVYAFTSGMWEFANSADVFTFGTFLLSLTLYAVIIKRFSLSFLFLGLLTSHFPNSAILFPALILYWKKAEGKSMKLLIQGCSVYFIGLLIFIVLLFLRMQQQPLIDWGHVTTLSNFYQYLTRKEFGGMFLIQTQQLTFSISNLFLQLWAYNKTMFIQFGFILPVIAGYTIIRTKLYKNSLVLFLIISFILLAGFNTFSLSSINPKVGINFQFNKFYLSSFTIVILLLGIGLGKIKDATARKYILPGILLIIIMIQLLVNFPQHNYQNNYFSQRMINDSLSELPNNAIAITITNQNFFEAWYEQITFNKYKNITLLYLPNNINTDYKRYHPEIFSHSQDTQDASLNKITDPTSQAVLDIIAKNPQRSVFIWQGVYENGKFITNTEFANKLTPYGLWWKVGSSQTNTYVSIKKSEDMLSNINYTDSSINNLNSVQRLEDIQTYTQALQATSFALVNLGKYDEGLNMLTIANSLINTPNIQKEIAAIQEIKMLESHTKTFTQAKDVNSLLELAMDYYTLRDFNKCIEMFKDIITFDTQNPQIYSNIASMYALENDKINALYYYNKALQIDPNLTGALYGKNSIESGK